MKLKLVRQQVMYKNPPGIGTSIEDKLKGHIVNMVYYNTWSSVERLIRNEIYDQVKTNET